MCMVCCSALVVMPTWQSPQQLNKVRGSSAIVTSPEQQVSHHLTSGGGGNEGRGGVMRGGGAVRGGGGAHHSGFLVLWLCAQQRGALLLAEVQLSSLQVQLCQRQVSRGLVWTVQEGLAVEPGGRGKGEGE